MFIAYAVKTFSKLSIKALNALLLSASRSFTTCTPHSLVDRIEDPQKLDWEAFWCIVIYLAGIMGRRGRRTTEACTESMV